MQGLRQRLTYANVMSTLAVFLVLGGGVVYAANTVFSGDIVDGEVKTPDLANGAVANAKLAGGAVTSEKVADGNLRGKDVLDNALTGADIDEASLALSFQGTAAVATRRTSVPAGGGSGDLVLNVPGFGEVRNKNCSVKSARSSFFNDTNKTVDVFTDATKIAAGSTDPLFAELAPGEETMGTEVEGLERAIYQAGFGTGRVATIVVMGRPDGILCHYQAQAVID
jgi:hypothetical protein